MPDARGGNEGRLDKRRAADTHQPMRLALRALLRTPGVTITARVCDRLLFLASCGLPISNAKLQEWERAHAELVNSTN